MRRVLALAIITAVAVLMLGGALVFFERKPPGNDVVAIRDFSLARPPGSPQSTELTAFRSRN